MSIICHWGAKDASGRRATLNIWHALHSEEFFWFFFLFRSGAEGRKRFEQLFSCMPLWTTLRSPCRYNTIFLKCGKESTNSFSRFQREKCVSITVRTDASAKYNVSNPTVAAVLSQKAIPLIPWALWSDLTCQPRKWEDKAWPQEKKR